MQPMNTFNHDQRHGLPYQAPYGYFENFEGRMLRRLETEATPQGGIFGRWLPRLALPLAAAVMLVVALLWYQQTISPAAALAAAAADEKTEYLLLHTDAVSLLLASDETTPLELPASWLNEEDAAAYLESADLEILMSEL
jgi:hypothetical protein